MLSIVFTLTVLAATLIGAAFGLLKGFTKSTIRLASVVLAVLIAFIIAAPVSRIFINNENLNALISMLEFTEMYNEIVEASPALGELFTALPVAIIAPIVFVVLFFIIKLIMLIPYFIVAHILTKDKEKEPFKKRALGLPIGAAQGLISVLVVVFVVAGFINIADKSIDAVLKDSSGALSDVQDALGEVDFYIEEIKRDPIISLLCGKSENVKSESISHNKNNISLSKTPNVKKVKNNFVFEGLSKIKFNGVSLSLTNECVVISETVVTAAPLFNSTSGFSANEIAAIENVVAQLEKSEMLTIVGADMISGVCEKWSNGEEFLGVACPSVNEDVDPIVRALLGTMKDSDSETLKQDMGDVVEILKVFEKHDLLNVSDTDSIMNNVNGDLIAESLTILSSNERLNVVIPEVTNLGIKMIATSLNISDISDTIYVESGNCELTEEDIKNIGEGFDHIFTFIESMESAEGGLSLDNLDSIDISSVGKALDSFKDTSLLGGAVDPLAGAIVETVTGSSDVTSTLENGNVSYESLMNTVQSTAGVLNNIQNSEASNIDKTQSIVSLLENITPENADVIIAIVNEDFIIQQGVDSKYASQTASVLKIALKEMSLLSNEEHESEAEKIKFALDIVTNTGKVIYGAGGVFETAKDVISFAMDSKVASAVLMDLAYDENGNEVYDALGVAASINDSDKEFIASEIQKYCDESKATATPEEQARIDQMQIAVSLVILGMK